MVRKHPPCTFSQEYSRGNVLLKLEINPRKRIQKTKEPTQDGVPVIPGRMVNGEHSGDQCITGCENSWSRCKQLRSFWEICLQEYEICYTPLGVLKYNIDTTIGNLSWICDYAWKIGLPRWLSGKESSGQCRRCKRPRLYTQVRKIPWSRKCQPTPVFLPGNFHGQRSPWGHKEIRLSNSTHAHTQKIKQNKNIVIVNFGEKKTERKSNYDTLHSSTVNNIYIIKLNIDYRSKQNYNITTQREERIGKCVFSVSSYT